MNTFVTHPEEGGPHPVCSSTWTRPGKREELHDMARRLAHRGLLRDPPQSVLPVSSRVRRYAGTFATRGEQMRDLMSRVDFATLANDTQAMLDHVDADPHADASRIGAVGYCMSGPFVYAVAGMFPTRIRAAASIYGVRLHGKGSPERFAAAVTGELYFACAELDGTRRKT